MKSDLPYLGHIVLRNFEVIGEAANRLSPAARDGAGPGSIAFRNRLIHGNWSVDLALVWDVIQDDLPGLKLEVAPTCFGISASRGDRPIIGTELASHGRADGTAVPLNQRRHRAATRAISGRLQNRDSLVCSAASRPGKATLSL